jgi:hypothetical protein
MISIYEYQRKAIHLFNLIIPFGYWFIIPDQNQFKIIIITFTVLFILADYFRKKSKKITKLFIIFFNKMLREHELKGQFTGATWVMISASVTILVFPKIYCYNFSNIYEHRRYVCSFDWQEIGK